MKTQPDVKTYKRKLHPNKTFYNYRNNDFLKTQAYFNEAIPQMNTEPEHSSQPPLDEETLSRLLKNNQGISDSINAIKFSERSNNATGHPRHTSNPLLSPIESSKPKVFNQKLDILDEIGSLPASRSKKKRELTLSAIQHQPDSAQFIYEMPPLSSHIVSPKPNSTVRQITLTSQSLSQTPKVTTSPKSLFNMTPHELQDLEKKVIAKNKLNMDRNMTLSRIGMRADKKQDVSYMFDKGRSPPASSYLPETVSATIVESSPAESALEGKREVTPERKELDSSRSVDRDRATFVINSSHKKSMFHLISQNATRTQTAGLGDGRRANSISIQLHSNKSNVLSPVAPKEYVNSLFKITNNSEFYGSFTQDSFKVHTQDTLNQTNPNLNNVDTPRKQASSENIISSKATFSPRRRNSKCEMYNGKAVDNEDLLNDLKKTLPNVLTGAPSSRQDVKILSDWVDAKISELSYDNTIKDEEKNIRSEQVFSICLHEIIRQITVDCAERGELLYNTWLQHTKTFGQAKALNELENQRIRMHYQEENQKQYEWYQQLLAKRDEEIEGCKQEIERLLQDKTSLSTRMDKLTVKNTKYKQRIDQLKGLMNKVKLECEDLKEDNRRYAKRLAFKIAKSNKGTYVPTFLSHNVNGAKENAREASVPQNLGVGSSVKSPKASNLQNQRSLKINLEATPNAGTEIGFDTKRDKDDSSDSVESSYDFAYEDETNSKQVFRIDHLNQNIVTYKKTMVLDEMNSSRHVHGMIHVAVETHHKETQTNLALVTGKYDEVLENQRLLDELLIEIKLKKEIDLLAENDNFLNGDFSKILDNLDLKDSRALKKNFSLSFGTKSLIEDKIDGILKAHSPKNELDAAKVLESLSTNLKKLGSLAGSDSNRSRDKDDYDKIVRESLERDIVEQDQKDKRNLLDHKVSLGDEEKISPRRHYMLPSPSPRIKTGSYNTFEPIEELQGKEDGRSFSRVQSGPLIDQDIIKEDAAEDEPETAVPKQKKPNNGENDGNLSYGTDDLCKSLNDAGADFGEGAENQDNHSEHADDGHPDLHKLSKNTIDEGIRESMNSVETPRQAQSFSNIVNLKLKATQLASFVHLKKEEAGVMDKAKLITILRMYKVEKEKNKSMQNSVAELEEQLFQEKQHQTKLQSNIDEMNVHIKMLEKLKAECPHGRCALCRGEQEDGVNENNEGLSTERRKGSIRQSIRVEQGLLQKGTEDEFHGEEGLDLDEEIEEEEDEEDEDDEGADFDDLEDGITEGPDGAASIPTRQLKNKGLTFEMNSNKDGPKLRRKKVTVGLRPELGKKKEKVKDNSNIAAWAIISKIKDKKLTKFKNFMPVKMVLKQIHTLYHERISQAKENLGLKEEEFYVFVYKSFLNNFGFRKIAEQKFIIFILSIKKHMHIVRINLFARFMLLSQGSANFTLDEFNRYLEGLDFINSSTMGIPIVNNETDSKIYTPFLRALEFLRNFSENKMPMDEYVEFKREFDSIKEADPKNINRNGIVDFDLFMTKLLSKYRIICSRTKQFVVNAFKAADLDGNKYCSLKEFVMIYQNIESDKFDPGFAENLFYENADIKVEGEINLSFDKFTVVCVEYGLFSDLQQDRFLGIQSPQDVEERMTNIKNGWPTYHLDIDTQLNKAVKASEEEKEYWTSILRVLNERITDFQKIDPVDYKPIIIAYRILEQEVQKLSDNEAERDAYGVKRA